MDKKEDTFNLSSKILYNKNAKLTTMYGIIQMEHVREFIKRLKEELYQIDGYQGHMDLTAMTKVEELIDKLSGDDLR